MRNMRDTVPQLERRRVEIHSHARAYMLRTRATTR